MVDDDDHIGFVFLSVGLYRMIGLSSILFSLCRASFEVQGVF